MPNPEDYKRVQLASGAKVTVLNVKEGMKVLEDEPAVDRNGRPLDAAYPEKAGEPVRAPYAEWTNDELRAEIETRNKAAGEDAQIMAEPPGNKPELVAALEADDARANS